MASWRSASPPRPSSAAGSVTAVIAAAGSGERLGAGGPKAFVGLAGRPMIDWSIAAFRAVPSVASIVVAAPLGHLDQVSGDDLVVVAGGESRTESVRNALAMVRTSVVAIHDAARPLITAASIIDLLAALEADPRSDAAIAAAPVVDTIKRAKEPTAVSTDSGSWGPDLIVDSTLDRSCLWSAQTPQFFRVKALRVALAEGAHRAGIATDEAMLVEAAGGRVLIHPSIAPNLKVTTPLDLMIAEKMLLGRALS